MNKYISLYAISLIFSLTLGCHNCGYKTAHSTPYESLIGTTRLASPQTRCNTGYACNTQLLANNGQVCCNPYAQVSYQNGCVQPAVDPNANATAAENVSLLDATQQQTAQSETPLRWRRVTDEEQQYASSSDANSVGIASALGNPAFGSSAPAPAVAPPDPNYYDYNADAGVSQALQRRPAPGVAPQYSGRRPYTSPRTMAGVDSALTPGRPTPGAAPQYSGQYAGQYAGQYPGQYSGQQPVSPRATRGVNSALSEHPLPPQYANQYPNYSPRVAEGPRAPQTPGYGAANSDPNSDPIRWRHVTEEEQQYSRSPRGTAPGVPGYGSTPGYGSSQGYGTPNSVNPNAQYPGYGTQEPLTVPVYPETNSGEAQTQTPSSSPEIDPNALPMPESPTGTF